MANTYETPGVYVEEISTLPPSVAGVATAIPAFIGYTAKRPEPGDGVQVVKIDTLLEYESHFGKAKPTAFKAEVERDNGGPPTKINIERDGNPPVTPEYMMHYSLDLYFKNGGGSCYVVSIGDDTQTPSDAHYVAGLNRLEQEDEPTLILLVDAVRLEDKYYNVCKSALAQCEKLGDRFAIFDLPGGDVSGFRTGIGTADLKYGAAYHPYLKTSLSYQYEESQVTVIDGAQVVNWIEPFPSGPGIPGIVVHYSGTTDKPKVKIRATAQGPDAKFRITGSTTLTLTIDITTGMTGSKVVTDWDQWTGTHDAKGFKIEKRSVGDGDGSAVIVATDENGVELKKKSGSSGSSSTNKLDALKTTETALYNQIKTLLTRQELVMPPSAAIAGVYARVDRQRGVWKAPANVSLSWVNAPTEKITHEDQMSLNVDPTAGKSINAIRQFAGKGTLVWGARTLAGNDNEWRYVSVRRLFNMIEESTQKASAFAVFEPNDATTWLKVKAMIESYLYGLWEQGALAGPTPEAAYFVNVGLGKTMTNQDILEGRMIVEIGVAAVRPAEFIILRFTHKMQEA